jgi:hypothetical protein
MINTQYLWRINFWKRDSDFWKRDSNVTNKSSELVLDSSIEDALVLGSNIEDALDVFKSAYHHLDAHDILEIHKLDSIVTYRSQDAQSTR